MRSIERIVWLGIVAALGAAWLTTRPTSAVPASTTRPRPEPGVRLSMTDLHALGGVPLGWQPTLPPGDVAAGRHTFDALGCPACHRVAGEQFASGVPEPAGPELTGMGSHHPPTYFAEAILNPDAVLIDGPGYLDAAGHSTMPTYDTMTVGELADVVAYLASLRDGGTPACHAAGAAATNAGMSMTAIDLTNRPSPPAEAGAFFTQSYDVLPGKLAELERWFAERGRAGFMESVGLLRIDTFVDAARPSTKLTTTFAFRDESALRTFLADPAMADLWQQFDRLVGSHGHVASARPLAYRAATLSTVE